METRLTEREIAVNSVVEHVEEMLMIFILEMQLCVIYKGHRHLLQKYEVDDEIL